MAIRTQDQQDDGLVDTHVPVAEHRIGRSPDVPPDEDLVSVPAVPPTARRAAGAFVALVVIVLIGSLLGPIAGANLTQILTLCLVLAGCFAVTGGTQHRSAIRPQRRTRRATRIALIGSQASAVTLDQELAGTRSGSYTAVGWITSGSARDHEFPMPPALGGMNDLAMLVERHRIDLLLIGSDVPRLQVFDELVRLTDVVSVRVCELSAFYESAFGHIPVTEINSVWFQYIMHPNYSTPHHVKRAFDLGVAICLGIVSLPVLLLAALLIKLDGGPVLYRQLRIGEKGRPFTMCKLRTMREQPPGDDSQTWCSIDDPRVTPVGRVLRTLHLDELPQLYNVLRGEMSIVGPRPEQTDIVSKLEAGIAFYSRRHLIKPGMAGWAQLRCGYARTERGSAWKLCHDLYYLKHQSLRLDIVILVRTFLMLGTQIAKPERQDCGLPTDQLYGFRPHEPTTVNAGEPSG